jgi:hypothetical protein
VAAVQHTFTHKQYTAKHNDTGSTNITHIIRMCKHNNKNTVQPQFTNASHHEQIGSRTIFLKKKSRVTNGVSINEHASRQQRLAKS